MISRRFMTIWRLQALLERVRPSPAVRLAMGLVALMTCLMLLIDITLDVTPDRAEAARRIRQASAELVAIQTAALLPSNDVNAVAGLLEELRARQNGDVESVAVRTRQGEVVAQSGDHARHWDPPPDDRSTLTHMRVPIFAGDNAWGAVELSFRPLYPSSVAGWVREPLVQGACALVLLVFGAYYLYLRRALQYLDPASAVPERVRNAFDTLSEGVMVTDLRGRIVLANLAFRKLAPDGSTVFNGRLASQVPWLAASIGGVPQDHPWARALADRNTIAIASLSLLGPGGEPTGQRVSVKATPINDVDGAPRGCLVTFDDVSRLFDMNQALRSALEDLKASRAEVQRKNAELERLASRDPLTGCLNRRAFFAALDELRDSLAPTTPITMLMCDIDHFKSFNDKFGHAIGDEVLVAVSALLRDGVRTEDLVCRMGGEEFCVAMPGVSVVGGARRADALRGLLEAQAGARVEGAQGLKITASFGLAGAPTGVTDIKQLLELADQSLYHAKRSGRNRVVVWPFKTSAAPVDESLVPRASHDDEQLVADVPAAAAAPAQQHPDALLERV